MSKPQYIKPVATIHLEIHLELAPIVKGSLSASQIVGMARAACNDCTKGGGVTSERFGDTVCFAVRAALGLMENRATLHSVELGLTHPIPVDEGEIAEDPLS